MTTPSINGGHVIPMPVQPYSFHFNNMKDVTFDIQGRETTSISAILDRLDAIERIFIKDKLDEVLLASLSEIVLSYLLGPTDNHSS